MEETGSTWYSVDRYQALVDGLVTIPQALALLTKKGESEDASVNLWIEKERVHRLKQARAEQRRERLGLSASATDDECFEVEKQLRRQQTWERLRLDKEREAEEAEAAKLCHAGP